MELMHLLYLILLKFIDFEKIIEEKRSLQKCLIHSLKNTSFKPMMLKQHNNILQAYPLIFKSKGEKMTIKIMIENRIDAYVCFHEILQ